MNPESKNTKGWELHRIADGSLSCENFSLDCDDIDAIESILNPVFGKRLKEAHIMVSYDNWSGVFIMEMPGPKTMEAERLIKEIYDFLKESSVAELSGPVR